MTDSRTTVSHDGVVVAAQSGRVRVRIISQSACAACHARTMCPGADTREKFIDAAPTVPMAPGDGVTVTMQERVGWLAVLVAFVLPFLLLLAVLLVVYTVTNDPVLAGLLALGSQVPYFLAVYFLRARLARRIEFTAEPKLNA